MLNGKQKGEANIEVLRQWIASKTDDDFRQIEFKGKLKRKEIAVECGFALSVLNQNPSVRDMLNELEAGLRQRGVLPQRAECADQPAGPSSISEKRHRAEQERIRRLETENAALKAENAELKGRLLDFGVLTDMLTATGRLPRWMSRPRQTIRVTSVRAARTGGALFVGVPIDPASGAVTNTKDFVVVNAYKGVLGGALLQNFD